MSNFPHTESPVCGTCMVLLKHDTGHIESDHWLCPVCDKEEELVGFVLWEFDKDEQELILRRSMLFQTREMVPTNIIVKAISSKRFPSGGDPNYIIRPWLEKNIGKQFIDWNWGIDPNNGNNIAYYFADEIHATLFELVWQ